jgi:hypothetical protein
MDYLFRKSDSSANSLGGTVGRVTLPEMRGGDVIFTGSQRPLDLDTHVLVKAIEVTEKVTSTKKRGPTTTTIDGDKQTVTLTHTAVDLTDDEQWASIRTQRDNLLKNSDWMGFSDVTMSSAWKTYRQALRDLPASESDPDDITFPDEPS